MIDPRRHLLALGQLLLIGVLFLVYDFGDRGPHFRPAEAVAKIDRAGVYDLERGRILTRVIGHVRSHYVDPSRVSPRKMVLSATRAIQQLVPEVTVTTDAPAASRGDKRASSATSKPPGWVEVRVDATTQRFELNRVRDLYEFNWKLLDIFGFLQRQLGPKADLEAIEYAAVNGALETLDPHSVLVEPEIYREMQLGTHGRFGGLGVVISIRDGVLTVMSVMDDTPASKAGLKSGDKIVQIGEESTINMPLNDAVNRLRGAPGSDVTIWIKRKGVAALERFKITREEIRIRSVDQKSLEDGIGYVRIRNFQGNTFDDLNRALNTLSERPEGLKGLVLDLRENPGGLLDQAIKVSDRFLSQGTVVTTVRERGKAREERHATRASTLDALPLVVLINRGSASASEIVAGALKHNGRALIVGSTSFGKGSVQVIYRIDDAALKLTIAQYLTPGDISIQSVGIVPDLAIQEVRVTKENIDLYPDEFDSRGEADLESHLENAKSRRLKPARRLPLLEVTESDDKDPLIDLASSLLTTGMRPDREGMMVAATGFLDRRHAEENAAIAKKLGTLGVDWSRGPNPTKPKLQTSVVVTREDGEGAISAGDTVRITATVTGDPARDIWRLHGVIRSEIHALDGREVVFGHVATNQERSWTTTVKLPRSLASQADRVHLDLFADGEAVDNRGHADILVSSLPRPRFAFDTTLSDADGNRDGLIQRGERITLTIHVTNVGKGAAEDTLVTIKNESGEAVYIEKGRHKVGAIAPGATHAATFVLKIREALTSQDVQLKVGLADQSLRTWSRADLSLPVFPAAYPVAETASYMGAAESGPVQVYSGPHKDTAELATLDKGSVVPVVARAGEWVQVRLRDGGTDHPAWLGWVPVRGLRVSDDAPKREALTRLFEHEPPAVDLDPSVLDGLQTDDARWSLSGVARFSGEGRDRRHVVIFRDNDKIFFQSGRAEPGSEDELPFSTTVPLVPGRNVIRVLVREGQDDVTGRTVIVYRR